MVAQELAITYPERVRALVLADTSFGTASTKLEALQTLLAKGVLRLLSVEQMAHLSARAYGRLDPAVGPYVVGEMWRHARDRQNYLNVMRAAFAFDSRDRLRWVACPTLILVGERNRRTHAQARAMARLISQAQLGAIPRAGHMLSWDNPDAFNAAVEQFLCRALVRGRIR